ncbi:hypothetical protein G6F31_017383 [Rhizopus arrhizus]|nr:hypothetical protein G6F31_017383 [Rhizopus arrhizus]
MAKPVGGDAAVRHFIRRLSLAVDLVDEIHHRGRVGRRHGGSRGSRYDGRAVVGGQCRRGEYREGGGKQTGHGGADAPLAHIRADLQKGSHGLGNVLTIDLLAQAAINLR